MKYLKLFEGFENINIVDICKQYNISNYVVNSDGTIDIDVDYVDLSYQNLTKLPIKFNKVNGYFDCSNNRLTSLEGSPKEINGDFNCCNNYLTSFEFAPKIIRGYFNCQYNNIKSFEYFPSFVKSYFWCDDNPIYEVWRLFGNTTKIELLNDFDVFRDEDTDTPGIVMDRLNDFLLTIVKKPVEYVYRYKNI